MKSFKLFSLLTLLWVGFATEKAQAQVDLTVNPIGLLFGDLSLAADFALTENFSVEGAIGIGGGKNDAASLKYFNLPITATGKYYFAPNHGADRFYLDVFTRFVTRNYSADDGGTNYAEYSQTRVGFGFGIGYKVVSGKGLVFDIGLGGGRAIIDNTKFDSEGDQFEVDWPSLMIVGKLGLGYRFGNR